MHHRNLASSAVLAACMGLAACGGSGDSGNNSAQLSSFTPVGAEGLYTYSDSADNHAATLILDDGTFYATYSTPTAAVAFVQGKGTASTTNATNFNASDMRLVSLSASNPSNPDFYFASTYVKGKTLQSQISDKLATAHYSTTFNYEKSYEQSAKLADVAASYDGTVAVGSTVFQDPVVTTSQTSTLTVSASGALSGSVTGGCTFTGTLAPHAQGNSFNATVAFGDAPCPFPKTTILGHAFVDPQTKRLNVATVLADRTQGALFSYVKK